MPRVNDGRKHARPLAHVRERKDGSTYINPKYHGPCSVDRDGNAVNGYTNCGYGSTITDTIARSLQNALVKATRSSIPGHRRRFRGAHARPKEHLDPGPLVKQRKQAHIDFLQTGQIRYRNLFESLTNQIRNLDPGVLERERGADQARERCHHGRARANKWPIFKLVTITPPAPAPARTAPPKINISMGHVDRCVMGFLEGR